MDNAFLLDMTLRLQAEQASLQAELISLRSLAGIDETRSEHAGMGNHMADDATDMFEQEKNLSLEQNTAQLLSQVEAARRRIDEGTYGLCETCGRPIDPARLETLAYATRCVTCKTRQEKI